MPFRPFISSLLIVAMIGTMLGAPWAQDGADAPPSGVDEFGLPLVTVVGNDTPSHLITAQLKEAGYDVTFTGRAAGQNVTIIAQNEPILAVLNALVAGKGWQWHATGERSFEIMDTATYEATVLPTQIQRYVIVPENLKASELAEAVKGVIDDKIGENVTADDRTNKLIVWALPATIEEIQRFVEEVDRDFAVRVFRIRYADPALIAEKLETLKSDPGTIEVDEMNRQIIVRDLFRNIQRMEAILAIYDQRPEMRVYQLNNLEFEEDNIMDLIAILQDRILTPEAFIDVNRMTGVLVVEDVPEVQDKVAQLLEVFDMPPKQVVIHAEIIETNFSKGLNYGLETKFSRDLFTAARDGLFPTRATTAAPSTGDGDGDTNGGGAATAGSATGIPYRRFADAEGNPLDKLGFRNFYREFPTISMGAQGLAIEYLTENAHLLFNAAISQDETRVLSQPRIMVQNKGEAFLKVGGQVAYRTASRYGYYGGGSDSGYDQSQARLPFGLILEMRVTITHDNVCQIDLRLTNDQVNLRGSDDNPLVDTMGEEFETTLRIPSGDTRVLAGLISSERKNSQQGVPLLSQIPWIGPLLFGSRNNSERLRNLMVFITPVVVEQETRQRRPSFAIEDILTMAGAEAADDDLTTLFRRDTATAMQDRMRSYRDQLETARQGDFSVLGLVDEDAVREAEPLPPAIPADTPFRGLDDDEEDWWPFEDLSGDAPPPAPPAPLIGEAAPAGAIPLTAGELEPLQVADHGTSPTAAAAAAAAAGPAFPQSSYIHRLKGGFEIPATAGATGATPGGATPAQRPTPPTARPASRVPPTAPGAAPGLPQPGQTNVEVQPGVSRQVLTVTPSPDGTITVVRPTPPPPPNDTQYGVGTETQY